MAQFLHPLGDRSAGDSRRTRYRRDPSVSDSLALGRRHQAPHPLVQEGRQRTKPPLDVLVVYHSTSIKQNYVNLFYLFPDKPLARLGPTDDQWTASYPACRRK